MTTPGHSGVGSLKSHFPGALECCSVEWSVAVSGQILWLFPRLSVWKTQERPRKGSNHQPVFTLWKVPLLSLPRLCHILGVTFWIFLVKLLSQDSPFCLPALLNALSMVGNALGFVSWLQDVALIARGTEEWLCPVLSGTASLCL